MLKSANHIKDAAGGEGEVRFVGERDDLKCRRDLQAGGREGKGKRREREHNMEVPREDYDNEG